MAMIANFDFRWIVAGALVIGLVLVLLGCFRKATPEERIEKFVQKHSKEYGSTVFRDAVDGKPLVLLLYGCKVYRLEATSETVTKQEVLKPGFLLWPTGCTGQKLWRDGEYIFAELRNLEFGAGGGNASGGTYRSRNGIDWEKWTKTRWLPVAEAQR